MHLAGAGLAQPLSCPILFFHGILLGSRQDLET